MSYLDRLKRLDSGEIFHYAPQPEPTKPTEPPFDGFVGTTPGAYENIHTENDADDTENQDGLIFQIVTRPLPTEPSKGIEYWHWRIQFPDRDPLEVFFNPDADLHEVMRQYPAASVAVPIPEPPKPVLSPSGKWYFTPHDPNKTEES
jgi:hypothetical protein